jgi:hypothetical protein
MPAMPDLMSPTAKRPLFSEFEARTRGNASACPACTRRSAPQQSDDQRVDQGALPPNRSAAALLMFAAQRERPLSANLPMNLLLEKKMRLNVPDNLYRGSIPPE